MTGHERIAEDPTIKLLMIVNDQPYGSERPYNALRLAGALAKREEARKPRPAAVSRHAERLDMLLGQRRGALAGGAARPPRA